MADAAQNNRDSDVYRLANEPAKDACHDCTPTCVSRSLTPAPDLAEGLLCFRSVAIGILEARYPSKRSCPSDPVFDRAVGSNATERVVEHKEEEFRFGFSRVAGQDHLKAFCCYGNP